MNIHKIKHTAESVAIFAACVAVLSLPFIYGAAVFAAACSH